MFKVHCRLAAALATLVAVLIITALPAAASAQVGEVTDAPFSFKNATDRNLTIEWISVVQRNGKEVPINITWTYKPGEYAWLKQNNQKITGVVCTFVVRTPGGSPGELPVLLAPGEVQEQVSAWNWYSGGTTEHGDVCILLTNDSLKAHLQSPSHAGKKFTPAIASAAMRHRQFLQKQIDRVKAAIQQDEDFIVKASVGAGIFSTLAEALEAYGKSSDKPGDAFWGRIAKGAGNGVANKAAQDIAAARQRIQANRDLLIRYQHELQLASLPKL